MISKKETIKYRETDSGIRLIFKHAIYTFLQKEQHKYEVRINQVGNGDLMLLDKIIVEKTGFKNKKEYNLFRRIDIRKKRSFQHQAKQEYKKWLSTL